MTNDSSVKSHYQHKSVNYGMGKMRLTHTLTLLANASQARKLDVGFGNGELGRYLKNKHNYVVGIDISTSAVKRAGKVFDKVYLLDIEKDALPKSKQFDVIILSEILEHLFSPENVLIKLVHLLTSEGIVLISTPNFLYWGNRISFLFGKFKYQPLGPFDSSHILFFTYTSLKELLENSGFTIYQENHLTASPMSQVLATYFPGFFAYHFIVLCKKRESSG